MMQIWKGRLPVTKFCTGWLNMMTHETATVAKSWKLMMP